jgi:PAS domain S-box-containing protein
MPDDSGEKYRAIFNQAGDAIAVHDLSGRFLEVNDRLCSRLGYTREELLGMSPQDLDDFDNTEKVQERIEEVQQTGLAIFETVHVGKDGRHIPVEISASLLTFDKTPLIISIARDITRRREIEESLRVLTEKLKNLSSATRHDINNKLTIISGYLQLTKADVEDEKIRNYVRTQEKALGDIAKILAFTKEYEKIGVQPPQWQDAGRVADLALSEADMGNVTVTNRLSGVEILADPLLERVFTGLADNAVKYGEKTTTVTFRYEQRGDDLYLICEDDGNGVPPAQKTRIFDRGIGKGTGLGLFIAKEILAITGLSIEETGEYGKGARFEIRVPKKRFRSS